jgi:hypothetical protein
LLDASRLAGLHPAISQGVRVEQKPVMAIEFRPARELKDVV